MVFVNSMSDLFHPDVPLDFIQRVFEVMADTPRHTYQILTKRSKRLASLADQLDWPPNVWMGVSIESEALRLPHQPPPFRPGSSPLHQRRTPTRAPFQTWTSPPSIG